MSASPDSVPRTIHVALIGETGAGKSTIVNVLTDTGKEIAPVDNNTVSCTTEAKEYTIVRGNTTYCIWDTRGINEPQEAAKFSISRLFRFGTPKNPPPKADSELKELLHKENPELVLLCVHASKIGTGDHWNIYREIYGSLPKGMKVAMVVTRVRAELQGSKWEGMKKMCETTARSAFGEFSGASMIEGVPEFTKLTDQKVKDCKDRILTLISKSCQVEC